MSSSKAISRPHVNDMRSHLICGICMGYFVDATTINECLHTFCRSCIVKYLDTSNYCPMCDVQIHKSKPLQNLRPDKMLQDLVYKVVPGFYASEVQQRREFYASAKEKGLLTPEADNLMTPEMRGDPRADSQHYSPDESISLSLEYYIDNDEENEDEKQEDEDEADEEEDSESEEKPNPTRRYYKCPAAVCIRILKKLLRSKYGLRENDKVDIIYNKECLPDHFTLMDVGYIFSCKKKGLLKFYFRFYTKPQTTPAVGVKSVKRPISDNVNGEVKRPRVSSDETGNTQAANARNSERQISQPLATSTHSTSVPLEEPEKRPVKENSPAARLPSPKRSLERKDDKPKRSGSVDESSIPPSKKPKPAESPRPHMSPVPPATTPPAPKQLSEPPKPIQPGLKPPSQTSLLLKQQIAQQREQQKKMQIKQQQQQQILKMQRQQMMNQKQAKVSLNKSQPDPKTLLAMKQMPQLQKLPPKPPVKSNGRPVMPQPTTASIGTQSLPIVTKTPEAAAHKQTMPTPKPTTPQAVKSPQVPTKPATSSTPTTVSVSTSTAISKPVSASPSSGASQTNHPPITTAEQRRLTNDMIEKNKMRPIVVIERHGNGRPKVKQVPSPLKLHQQMSREFNKIISAEQPSTTKQQTTPATTLTVAPTDSATKLKIVKTPTTSPENSAERSKKSNEAPKSSSPAAEGETPKGKSSEEGVLDLSGKSSRKSDSPRSSIGSPSPPAPKVPSPVLATTEPKKSPPAPPKPTPPPVAAQPPKQQQPQPQMHQQSKPQKPPQSQQQKKDQNIMKIAQNCLNEKFAFFRQFPPATTQAASPPTNVDPSTLNKINSFSYHSLMNEALIRSKQQQQQQQFKAFVQQQSRGVRPQHSQGSKPATYGPRSTAQVHRPAQNNVPIRIPNPSKSSTSNDSPMMTPTRVPPRIHDLFPNPQAKPGPNQAVRHIPNPSLLGRQNAMRMPQPMDPAAVRKDEITITPARNPASMSNPSINSLRKIETLTQNLQRSICESKMSTPSMSVGVVATEASQ